MFNLGLSEVVLISVLSLIFIGPKQLPEIARALGRALNELKRASEDLTSSITNPKNYSNNDHELTPHSQEKTSIPIEHPNEIQIDIASEEPKKKDEGSPT
jgi:sec-independent protein translocase protein TatB